MTSKQNFMSDNPSKKTLKSWSGQRCHPNAPAGGGGPGNFARVGPFQSNTLNWDNEPHLYSPAARHLSPQEICDPSFTERVKSVVKAYVLALGLAPEAVYQETGYQLGQIIEGFLPGLLQMLAVLGISVVVGAGAGAAIGFFLGGVGAAPGAVVGGELGLEIGTAILTWMGLGFLAVTIGQGMGELTDVLKHAIRRAWNAAEHVRPQFEIDAAAHEWARAVGILFRLILQGILAYVLKKGAVGSSNAALSTGQTILKGGTRSAADGTIAEVSALLRKSELPEGFVVWIERNWEDLKRNPKLVDKRSPTTGGSAVESTTEKSSQLNNNGNNKKAQPTKNDLKSKPQALNEPQKKLQPGSAGHKADRWGKYQNRGGQKNYEAWSKQYDTNMQNYKYGLEREAEYRSAMGATEGTVKTPLTNRQIDILNKDEFYAGQLKTGPVSLTKENALAISKDAELVKRGWQVEHILEKGASQPYLEALKKANIDYHIGPKIP